MEYTKGKWEVSQFMTCQGLRTCSLTENGWQPDEESKPTLGIICHHNDWQYETPPHNCICLLAVEDEQAKANARLIAAAPDLLVVSHNLAKTMGIDYAIKKLSTLTDDNMALGAAVILSGIRRQAKEAIARAKAKPKTAKI